MRIAASVPPPRLLLVERDLGRRAALAVALGTRYLVEAVASATEAQIRASLAPFDLAVLDAAVLEASLPRLVRALRRRSAGIRIVLIAGRRDLRGRHYAASLAMDATLGRPTSAYVLLERIHTLGGVAPRPARFDRGVGRAIDLMARDVTHLLDVHTLAHATGMTLAALAGRFRAETGLSVHEFATRVRVAAAEALLRDTDLGVATLAELLGFADAAELARAGAVSRLEV
jgi:transcriptional regulator GlxA family with amidase domain